MSRKSKSLRSDEDIMNCLFELDSNDEESDLFELEVMYNSENDNEYNPDESEEGGDDYGSDSSESSDLERPIKKKKTSVRSRRRRDPPRAASATPVITDNADSVCLPLAAYAGPV